LACISLFTTPLLSTSPFFFFSSCSRPPRDLHSFPTRRSSDLALDTYVKSLGRGVMFTGGDNSYALGGYMGTQLEEMLPVDLDLRDRKSTRLNSSHVSISYAVFCLKKKKKQKTNRRLRI